MNQLLKKETTLLPLTLLHPNEGQILGLPRNPRKWSGEELAKLEKSLRDDPEFLQFNPLIVYPYTAEDGAQQYVIIGGNMRYTVIKDRKMFEKVPCMVLPANTTAEKLRAYTIKDNTGFGEWDWELIGEDWSDDPLEDWGLDLQSLDLVDDEERMRETERLSSVEFTDMYYTPEQLPNINLRDCIDMDLYDKKMAFVESLDLSPEIKEVLRILAYRFIRIDFESVANYYAFNATEEEKKAIERLRLVLVDGAVDGFIGDNLLRVINHLDEETSE